MKILIIEDDQNKYDKIKEALEKNSKELTVTRKSSYNSGLKELLKKTYDLILLDMSLPTYDISNFEGGGEPRTFAGTEILNQMKRYNKVIPTLVITQFETFGKSSEKINLSQLKEKLKSLKYTSYIDIVYYNAAVDTWEKKINEVIEELGEKNA